MKVLLLRAELKLRGQNTKGLKTVLVERLQSALRAEAEEKAKKEEAEESEAKKKEAEESEAKKKEAEEQAKAKEAEEKEAEEQEKREAEEKAKKAEAEEQAKAKEAEEKEAEELYIVAAAVAAAADTAFSIAAAASAAAKKTTTAATATAAAAAAAAPTTPSAAASAAAAAAPTPAAAASVVEEEQEEGGNVSCFDALDEVKNGTPETKEEYAVKRYNYLVMFMKAMQKQERVSTKKLRDIAREKGEHLKLSELEILELTLGMPKEKFFFGTSSCFARQRKGFFEMQRLLQAQPGPARAAAICELFEEENDTATGKHGTPPSPTDFGPT